MDDICTYVEFGTAILVFATTIISVIVAFLVKQGILQKEKLTEAEREAASAKRIAAVVASALEKIKVTDPGVGKLGTDHVVRRLMNGEKEKLDALLKEHDINQEKTQFPDQ